MTALLTDFSVTSALGSPTPSPSWPMDGPVDIDSVSVPLFDDASVIPPLSIPVTSGASALPAVSVSIIGVPSLAAPESVPAISTPSAASAQSSASINTPSAAASVGVATIDTPSAASSVSAPAISTPSAITAKAGTATTPPFPLNHARILWDNLLFNYLSVSASTGVNQSDAIIPNTWERWDFSATGWIKITLPAAVSIDTICVCAHNLSDNNYSIRPYYRETSGGALLPFGTSKSPSNNAALMWHNSSPVSAQVVEIYTSGGSGASFIGYISAGIALQMQRPFWGTYTPVCENLIYEYFDAWTESGQLVGRSERSVMIEGSYSWQNIDDTWYRTYFEPFKRSGHRLPFVFAWNLSEYPNDVEMVMANNISAAAYSGTRKLRNIDIAVQGVE